MRPRRLSTVNHLLSGSGRSRDSASAGARFVDHFLGGHPGPSGLFVRGSHASRLVVSAAVRIQEIRRQVSAEEEPLRSLMRGQL